MNTALAFLVPAVGMVLMSFVATPDLEVICVVVLVVTFAFNGGTNAGHIQNIIGLAPNRSQCSSLWCLSSNQSILHRSGTLYGFTNGFGNISGYLVPEIKKQIVKVPLDIFIIKHDHYYHQYQYYYPDNHHYEHQYYHHYDHQDETSLSEWRWLFFITAGVNVVTTFVFSLCASPAVQVTLYMIIFRNSY